MDLVFGFVPVTVVFLTLGGALSATSVSLISMSVFLAAWTWFISVAIRFRGGDVHERACFAQRDLEHIATSQVTEEQRMSRHGVRAMLWIKRGGDMVKENAATIEKSCRWSMWRYGRNIWALVCQSLAREHLRMLDLARPAVNDPAIVIMQRMLDCLSQVQLILSAMQAGAQHSATAQQVQADQIQSRARVLYT